MSIRERVGAVPNAFGLLSGLFGLLWASNNPQAFIRHAREGDLEAAFDTIDRPNEELHEQVSSMREGALELGDEVPELREADPEELN